MWTKDDVSPLYLFAFVNTVPDRYNDWVAAYDKLAVHVAAEEPDTRTYYFGIPIDYADDHSKTDTMLAFEQYGKWDDLYTTHLHSESMGKFLTTVPPTMASGMDLNNYGYEAGNIDYPGDMTECAFMMDTVIKCKNGADRAVVISKLRELGAKIDSLEESKELSILTWLGVSCVDNDTDLRIFTRFRTKPDLEAYQRREEVIAFWFDVKEQVDRLSNRQYVPNLRGWLHR